MPVACKYSDGKIVVEATVENLERLRGLRNLIRVGPDFFIIAPTESDWLYNGLPPAAPPDWWVAKKDACSSCRTSARCMIGGGPDRIFANKEAWQKCGLIGDVVDAGKEVSPPGKYFGDGPRKNVTWDKLDKELEQRGFTGFYPSYAFIEPSESEVQTAKTWERHRVLDDPEFTDVFYSEKVHGLRPRDLSWNPDAVRVYVARKNAQGVLAGVKNSETAAFKREECSNCAYSCRPLGNYFVKSMKNRPASKTESLHSYRDGVYNRSRPMVPSVMTNKACAIRQSELETEFNGSDVQIDAMVASIMAGETFNAKSVRRGSTDAIVYGQQWTSDGCGWLKRPVVSTRRLSPPYAWIDDYTVEDACKEFNFDYEDLRSQVESLGEKLPLTFWALKRIGLICEHGEAKLKSSNKILQRNDVLYIKLMTENRYGRLENPEIHVGSDNLSRTHGFWSGKNAPKVDISERPRFLTTYVYPFFDDIQRQTERTPGSGRG